jgi:hypothetical protein
MNALGMSWALAMRKRAGVRNILSRVMRGPRIRARLRMPKIVARVKALRMP